MKLTTLAGLSLAVLLLLASVPPVAAQSAAWGERQAIESRISELESLLAGPANGDGVQLRDELTQLRRRLAEGDFRPGDAIALRVFGDSTLSNTFYVMPPRHLRLPGMEPMDLTGVLRDEIQDYLDSELRRYLREPEFTAVPLTRIAVTGGVNSPGYYLFQPDTPLLDVFTVAGGLTRHAKLDRIELRRFGETVVGRKEFQEAMRAGWELERLPYEPGDEIFVDQAFSSTRDKLFVVSALIGLTYTVVRIFR